MRSRLFALLLGTLLMGNLVAQTTLNNSKISENLYEQLKQTPNDYHEVMVVLSDYVDVRAMDIQFYAENASLEKRTRTVIHALKSKAAATQSPILQFVSQNENFDKSYLRAFWVVNVIFVKANKEGVALLSQRVDIDFLDVNGQLALEAYEEEEDHLFKVNAPNSAEPGLRAVNAPAMWALGYTGYGTTALSIDTGVDPTHPALLSNYKGHYVDDSESWFDYDHDTPVPNDCSNHGTHTVGTILGLDKTTNDTIGVAFGALWMASQTLCGGSNADNLATFQWAIDPDGDSTTIDDMPDAICNSWFDPSAATTQW